VREPTGQSSVGRLFLGPMRAVAAPTFDRAVDAVLAGHLPESVVRSVVEHRVVQRIAREALNDVDVDQAVTSVLASERAERLLREILTSPALERALQSPEFERVLGQILASPQVRSAITQQSTTLVGEAGAEVRRRAVLLDDDAERQVWRWLRRPARSGVAFAGVVTRGAGLAIDAVIVTILFLVGAGLAELLGSLVGGLRPPWLAWILAVAAGLVLYGGYFAGFWSTTGQTPGMRLMRVRVQDSRNAPPRFSRALLRLGGLVLAIIPCFAGFLPALADRKRRALQDFLAGTVVVYDGDGSGLAEQRARRDAPGRRAEGEALSARGTSGTGPQ
jgi:uncharacterized RDD family membrane protein YckC